MYQLIEDAFPLQDSMDMSAEPVKQLNSDQLKVPKTT